MKTRIKVTVVAAFAALVAFSTITLAETKDPGAKMEKRIEHRIEKMKKKLNLSDAQVTQAKAILEESKPQMIADWQKMKAAPKEQKEAVKAEMKKDRDAVKEKLMAVLTPDQRTKAEAFFARHHEKDEHEKNEK